MICLLFGHKYKWKSYYGESIYNQIHECKRCGKEVQRFV